MRWSCQASWTLSCLILLNASSVIAAGGQVTIILVEKKTGKPVAAAPLIIDGTRVHLTDENGQLQLKNLDPGTHLIQVNDPEHLPFSARFEAPAEKPLLFALDGKEAEEEEIVIRAQREKENVTQTRLEMTEVSKVAGTQGDPIKIVQSLPGVARTLAISGSSGPGIVVRGSAPEDSKVMLDGHDIPLLYHFGGLKSVLNSDFLESIDFMPGGFGVQYGDATGGVIEVTTRPAAARRFGGYAELGLLDASLFLEGPLIEDLAFKAAARRSTVDIWLPAVIPDQPGLELTVAPVYYDYQLRLDWVPRQESRLQLLVFGSHDEMKFLLEKPPSGDPSLRGDMSMWVDFHRGILKWTQAPTGRLEWKASLSGGVDRARVGMGQQIHLDISVPNLELRLEGAAGLLPSLRLHAGVIGGIADFATSMSMPRPPKEGEIPSAFPGQKLLVGEEHVFTGSLSAFAHLEYRPTEPLMLNGGVRLDWYGPPMWKYSLSPRAAVRWKLRPGTLVKAAAGLYQQSPQEDELSRIIGNPHLGLERAVHYTFGLEQELTAQLRLEVESFVKTLERLVVRDDETFYANRGRGRINGLDVLIRRDAPDSLFGWLAYTLMRSRRQDGPDRTWRLFDFDQTHILTLVLGYRLPSGQAGGHGYRPGWEFGLRFQLTSGNPYTPIVDSVFDADYDTYQQIPGEINSRRLPLFHQLDLRVDYTWCFEYFALSVFLDVQNVYNHRAAEAVIYNYDVTQQAYIQGLPILPFLGVRGAF
jgi:hypothetical protein